jgi:hypothetical protein
MCGSCYSIGCLKRSSRNASLVVSELKNSSPYRRTEHIRFRNFALRGSSLWGRTAKPTLSR